MKVYFSENGKFFMSKDMDVIPPIGSDILTGKAHYSVSRITFLFTVFNETTATLSCRLVEKY